MHLFSSVTPHSDLPVLSHVIIKTTRNLTHSNLSVMVSPDDPFSCPACYAEGPNALEDCEETNKLLPCKGYHSVCYTQSNKNRDFVARGCSSREYYKRKDKRCNMKGTCVVSMCDTSGCTAGLPEVTFGRNIHFEYNYIGDYWKFSTRIGCTWGDFFRDNHLSGFLKMVACQRECGLFFK